MNVADKKTLIVNQAKNQENFLAGSSAESTGMGDPGIKTAHLNAMS